MRSRTHTKLKEQKKDFIKSLFTPIGCGYEQKYCDCVTQKSLDRSVELILVKIKFQIVARFSIHYKFRAFVHIVLQCALNIHITWFWVYSSFESICFFLLLLHFAAIINAAFLNNLYFSLPLSYLFSCVYNCNLLKYFLSFEGAQTIYSKCKEKAMAKRIANLFTRIKTRNSQDIVSMCHYLPYIMHIVVAMAVME